MKLFRKTWLFLLILCLLTASTAFSATENQGLTAQIKSDVTLLYQPRPDAASLVALQKGAQVKVLDMGLSWCKVEVSGKSGYLSTRFLSFSDVTDAEAFAVITAQNGRLTLREKPSTKSKALGKYNNGNIVAVLEKDKAYTKVGLDGKVGYLLTTHLTFTSVRESLATGLVMNAEDASGKRTVKLRTAAKMGDNAVAQYKSGTPLVILARGGDWFEVELSGKIGYMMSKYIQEDASAATLPTATPAPTALPQTTAPAATHPPAASPTATPAPIGQ